MQIRSNFAPKLAINQTKQQTPFKGEWTTNVEQTGYGDCSGFTEDTFEGIHYYHPYKDETDEEIELALNKRNVDNNSYNSNVYKIGPRIDKYKPFDHAVAIKNTEKELKSLSSKFTQLVAILSKQNDEVAKTMVDCSSDQ